jgi:uncharacterized Tic20 family protein
MNKKAFEMTISMIIGLILAVVLIVIGVWIAIKLGVVDFGIVSRVRDLFRFGG